MQTSTNKRYVSIPQGRAVQHCGMLLSFLTLGCGKQDVPSDPEKNDRTILVYMAANNDLKYDALRSLDQMEEGYPARSTARCSCSRRRTDRNICCGYPGGQNLKHII